MIGAPIWLWLLISSLAGLSQQQQQQQQQNVTSTTTVKPNYLETSRQITNILDRFMSSGYDKRVRPNYGGPPVEVNVTMRILSISSVSEVMMDFTADFYFRQTWHDPRLAFKKLDNIRTLYVGAEVSKKIWLPDTFFGNEKLAYFHEATTPNVFLRIDHSGEVYRSIRLTVTSSCPMNLQYFPMDRQRCTIEAESYGYNVKDIIYRWSRKGSESAVERDHKISLPQFDIVKTVQKYRLEELSSGTYSRLIAEIHFARRMGYYLIQIYIPSSLIVVISWVSFWLHRNASPARVQLGVTTVLTMTTLMSSTNAALPKISYVKSIDIFLGTCFVMVFAALLEYATVGYLGKRIAMRKAQAQHAQSQAQARIFAQLQAQGAQGDPVGPFGASMPATGNSEASPLLLNSPNIFASSTIQQAAANLAAQQQQAASFQQDPMGQSMPRGLTINDTSTCSAHNHNHNHHHHHHHHNHHLNSQHRCNEPPAPPVRRHRGGCECSAGSQTLPRNITFAGHPSVEDTNNHLHCTHQANWCGHHQHQHHIQQTPLVGQCHQAHQPHSGEHLPPPVGSKGAQAAATAAAATFINLHRRNKGLPPSSNPNFAQFAALASPYNRHLETIFGIRPSDIDKYSRVVFPVCFVCFQLMYWIVYLHISAFLETELGQQ